MYVSVIASTIIIFSIFDNTYSIIFFSHKFISQRI